MGSFSEKLGSAHIEVRANMGKLKADLKGAVQATKSATQKMSAAFKKVGRNMTQFVSLPIVAIGGSILKMAGDFESGMNRVRVLTGTSGEAFDALNDKAKELGRTTAFSASQVADGMGFLAQAGFEAEEVISSIGPALDLAAASGQGLAETADQMSNIMQGFSLSASDSGRAADVLALAASSTNTSVAQLAESMKFAAPVANALGMSIEETAAILGMMGNAGIQASMAGTSMRQAFVKLLKPTEEAAGIIKKYGINVFEADGKTIKLAKVFDQVSKSGMTAAEQVHLFGVRVISGALALQKQGVPAIDALTESLNKAGGEAARQAEGRMEGLNGQILKLKSAAEGLAIEIGDAGLLGVFTRLTTSITDSVAELAKSNPEYLKFGIIVAGVFAAIGPLVFIIGALLSPIGLAVTAIVGITTVLVTFKDEILAAANATGEYLKKFGEFFRISDSPYKKALDKFNKNKEAIEDNSEAVEELTENTNDQTLSIEEQVTAYQKMAAEMRAAMEAGQEAFKKTQEEIKKTEKASEEATKKMKRQWGGVFDEILGLVGGLGGGKFSGIISSVGGILGEELFGSNKSSKSSSKKSSKSDSSSDEGGGFFSAIGDIFGGFFADGGKPPVGKVSVVGEQGPELFVPTGSGTIIPNGTGGGGGVTVNINQNFALGVQDTVRAEVMNMRDVFKRDAVDAVTEAVGRGGSAAKAIRG